MIRMNRTTEYGLMALRHMSRKSEVAVTASDVTSAREVADSFGIPFEITAKTLQRLRDTGLIHSAQGAKGGYTLQRALSEVSLGEYLRLMEGPQGVVACAGHSAEPVGNHCEYQGRCDIRNVLGNLNSRISQFLDGIKLDELIERQGKAS